MLNFLLQIQILIPINYVRHISSFPRVISHNLYLVGEAAGKAPLGVVKKEEVNMSQLRGKADSASGVVNETRMVCRRIYLYISIENFL